MSGDKASLTLDEIKAQLPAVTVNAGGRVYPATVTGRLNRFATVSFQLHGLRVSYEFAWPTVQSAVNGGQALKV